MSTKTVTLWQKIDELPDIEYHVGPLTAGVEKATPTLGGGRHEDWVYIACDVMFRRLDPQTRKPVYSTNPLPYRRGIGHIDWKVVQRRALHFNQHHVLAEQAARTMLKWGARIKVTSDFIALCSDIAWQQNRHAYKTPYVKPLDPLDVLHSYALDATPFFSGQSFEEWCDDFGMHPDSKTADRLYHECVRVGPIVANLFDTRDYDALPSCVTER